MVRDCYEEFIDASQIILNFQAQVHTHIHTYTHTYTHTYIHYTYIHSYIHTHTNTHTHTKTQNTALQQDLLRVNVSVICITIIDTMYRNN
jgi:hypothetical protein